MFGHFVSTLFKLLNVFLPLPQFKKTGSIASILYSVRLTRLSDLLLIHLKKLLIKSFEYFYSTVIIIRLSYCGTQAYGCTNLLHSRNFTLTGL